MVEAQIAREVVCCFDWTAAVGMIHCLRVTSQAVIENGQTCWVAVSQIHNCLSLSLLYHQVPATVVHYTGWARLNGASLHFCL